MKQIMLCSLDRANLYRQAEINSIQWTKQNTFQNYCSVPEGGSRAGFRNVVFLSKEKRRKKSIKSSPPVLNHNPEMLKSISQSRPLKYLSIMPRSLHLLCVNKGFVILIRYAFPPSPSKDHFDMLTYHGSNAPPPHQVISIYTFACRPVSIKQY
jgi:hypothetical protein